MARERYGNGYKGRGATRRKMRANFRGFADHSARSLKPVHGRVGPAKRCMAQSLKYGLAYGKAWR